MRLVGQPRPAELADYRRAADELDGRLAALPGLVALYSLGGVTAPGISDLDRVAVVDTAGRVPPVWPELSEATRELAMHPPFLVERDVFTDHRLIAHLEPLELSTGHEVEVAERPDPAYVERVLGAESLLINVVRMLKYRATGRVKVRAALCQMHTVRHGLRLAALDRSVAPAAWALAQDVEGLRESWFALAEEPRERRLRRLVLEAVPALAQALDALAASCPGANGRAGPSLALGGAWTGITLREATAETAARPGVDRRLTVALAGLSAQTAEAAWRLVLRRRELLVPASLLRLLVDCPGSRAEICARRARLLAAHREFLAGRGSGYTSIEIAPPLRRV